MLYLVHVQEQWSLKRAILSHPRASVLLEGVEQAEEARGAYVYTKH